MLIDCPCGTQMNVPEWKIKSGKGKFCSNQCKYTYRTRPSGLKYNIVQENPSWVKFGEHLSPKTQFQPGHGWKGGYYQVTYGISYEQREAQKSYQKDLCAICRAEMPLETDHDHKTGQVRGLLCGKCNKGLGLFNDNTELLNSAITYLKQGGVWKC